MFGLVAVRIASHMQFQWAACQVGMICLLADEFLSTPERNLCTSWLSKGFECLGRYVMPTIGLGFTNSSYCKKNQEDRRMTYPSARHAFIFFMMAYMLLGACLYVHIYVYLSMDANDIKSSSTGSVVHFLQLRLWKVT